MWRIVMMAILCMQLVACSAATDLLGKVESTPSGSTTTTQSTPIKDAISTTTAQLTPIQNAVVTCDLKTSQFVQVLDDGYSLILDGINAPSKNVVKASDLACVLQKLGVPTYIPALMVRSGAKIQREEIDAYKIYWSYPGTLQFDGITCTECLSVIIHMK
jgi:hypothetical protein